MPEVSDGVDNDCDGLIDNVPPARVTSRAMLLVPAYLKEESPEEVDTVSSVLDQWGITHERPTPTQTFDEVLQRVADEPTDYPLVIVVGYLVDEYLSPHRQDALERYAAAGGTVVIVNPVFEAESRAHELIGTESIARRDDVEALVLGDAPLAVLSRFDAPEERYVPLDNTFSPDASRSVNVLVPKSRDTEVLASAWKDGAAIGALITRRRVGAGRVYALGHQLIRFHHGRCYINCFEPSGDFGGLFFRELLREATAGHIAVKHTAPGPEDSVLLLTHDVDSFDAQHAGEWGSAGALQVAELERRHGARGSFFVTTGEEAGPLSGELMQQLCELGVCATGAHSVLHGHDFANLPLGTCEETTATYSPTVAPTLCGEIRVSMSTLQTSTGAKPVAWRSPFLLVHPEQYAVLQEQGILFDSSYAVGDLKFNLPLSLDRTGMFQHVFRHSNLITMPISLEDGIAESVDGQMVRRELSAENLDRFIDIWTTTLLRNADNDTHTMSLLHPSFGWDVPADNLRNKLALLERVLTTAKARNVKVDSSVAEFAAFWRAREATRLFAHYDNGEYIGSLETGALEARHLTLEFGDVLSSFDCPTCGALRIVGNRVVIDSALKPSTFHAFRASTRPQQ